MDKNQLLVIASDALAQAISQALSDNTRLEIIRAGSDTDAVELMVTTEFAAILLEMSLPEIDPLKIGARLSRHGNHGATPLLLMTDASTPLDIFEFFPSLLIDFLPKPIDPRILKAKIKIFLELYHHKIAAAQGMAELDNVYEKIMTLHRSALAEQDLRREMVTRSSAFAKQMHSPLKNIQAGIYQLQKARDLPPQLGQRVNHLRNAAEQIAGITKSMSVLAGCVPKPRALLTDDTGAERPCDIVYATGSKDEFDILRHYISNTVNCVLVQADTRARTKEILSAGKPDILFIDQMLSDGTGLDLLSDLNRRRSDIPIIFTLDNSHLSIGAKAIAGGAYNFFIKERISTRNILAIIRETLEKSRLAKEIKTARDKIVLISRRDHLTRLHNRQHFDQTLKTEMDKAGRYHLPLSILMVDFDKFKCVNQTHGYEMGDQILRAGAVLVQDMVRNLDLVFRHGGEEFGIVLPNTDLKGANILAQRILDRIRSHNFGSDGTPLYLTISIGIATHGDTPAFPSYGHQDLDLVKQAQEALGLAVQQGGNTIQHSPESVPTP